MNLENKQIRIIWAVTFILFLLPFTYSIGYHNAIKDNTNLTTCYAINEQDNFDKVILKNITNQKTGVNIYGN